MSYEIATILPFFFISWVLTKYGNDIDSSSSFGIALKAGMGILAFSFNVLAFIIGREYAQANAAGPDVMSMFTTGWTIIIGIIIAISSGLALWSVWRIIKLAIDTRKGV